MPPEVLKDQGRRRPPGLRATPGRLIPTPREGQKSRRLIKGPSKYATSDGDNDDNDDKTDTGVEKLKTSRRVVPSLVDISSGGRLQQLL